MAAKASADLRSLYGAELLMLVVRKGRACVQNGARA